MTDKVRRQCPQTTTFESERRAEAKSNRGPPAYQPTALPLGQTGSPVLGSPSLCDKPYAFCGCKTTLRRNTLPWFSPLSNSFSSPFSPRPRKGAKSDACCGSVALSRGSIYATAAARARGPPADPDEKIAATEPFGSECVQHPYCEGRKERLTV